LLLKKADRTALSGICVVTMLTRAIPDVEIRKFGVQSLRLMLGVGD